MFNPPCIDVADQEMDPTSENAMSGIAVDEALTWKLVGKEIGGIPISLPKSFRELKIYINADSQFYVDFSIIRDYLSTAEKIFNKGYHLNSQYYAFVQIVSSTTRAYDSQVWVNGSDITSKCTITVYYR